MSLFRGVKEGLLVLASAVAGLCNRLLGNRASDTFSILMYHRVVASRKQFKPDISVEAEVFRKQLSGLLEMGYVFWPLDKLIDFYNREIQVPPKVLAITFDDGFMGVYSYAWPILKELNIPATIFINTAYLDNNGAIPFDQWGKKHQDSVPEKMYRHLTTKQCMEMLGHGLISIGSHTHSHQDFRHRLELFKEDLQLSIDYLNAKLGIKDPLFAFPYGNPRLGFATPEDIEAAKNQGVNCALNTLAEPVTNGISPFHWGRFNVFYWDSAFTLGGKAGGWYSFFPRLWGRLFGKQIPNPTCNILPEGFQKKPTIPHSDNIPELISIIIPSYNRASHLAHALESLVEQLTDNRFDYELVIVDNNSTDNTKEIVMQMQQKYPIPIHYRLETVQGDGAARNRGINEARGNWLAFFDDDQIAAPTWLSELWQAAKLLDSRIIGGRVKTDLPVEEMQKHHPYIRMSLREIKLSDYYHPYFGNIFPGCGNALVHRIVFDKIGLFDTGMTVGGSDYDFFIRARKHGFALWFSPFALIYHHTPSERLEPAFLKREAFIGGGPVMANLDLKYKGFWKTTLLATARGMKGILYHLPLGIGALIIGHKSMALAHQLRLLRITGYVWRTFFEQFPQLGRRLLPDRFMVFPRAGSHSPPKKQKIDIQ